MRYYVTARGGDSGFHRNVVGVPAKPSRQFVYIMHSWALVSLCIFIRARALLLRGGSWCDILLTTTFFLWRRFCVSQERVASYAPLVFFLWCGFIRPTGLSQLPSRFSSCVLIRFGPARSLSLRAFSRSAVAEGRQNAVCGACFLFSFYLRYLRVELAGSKKKPNIKGSSQLVLSRSAGYLFRSRP